MSLRSMTPSSKRFGQLYATLAYWYGSPTLRFAIFQALTIALVSILVGAMMFVASADKTLFGMIIVSMVALSPFVLIIAAKLFGSLKRLLVAIIVFEIPIGFDINFGFSQALSDANAGSGFNVSITTFCLIILYVLWFVEIATGATKITPKDYLRKEWALLAY